MECFRVGARGSQLSLVQTKEALKKMEELYPTFSFQMVSFTTVGDRDLKLDLRKSPGDFFTRELDAALLAGEIDFAVHSAKDLPDPVPESLDWFWLPWREDPRDAWVLPVGKTWEDLPAAPVIGVSSDRREACALRRFPSATMKPLRGTIPARLEQLDGGAFDLVLMAGAALNRLGLSNRISEWIPLSELAVPEGQGVLAVTFRRGDERMMKMRMRFVKAVRFVGAGVGSADLCTWGGVKDLQSAEVCLYDVLMDQALTACLPKSAQAVFVGKRCGEHSMRQEEITAWITRYARQGKRVVRLKGGDPGFFGRLAEETEALDALQIPYRVRPGVSALMAATTGTGMLLTRRGESRGFTALTPRAEGGAVAGVSREIRERLPIVAFMSIRVSADVALQLLREGWDVQTPAAVVFHAGSDSEQVVRATLGDMAAGMFAAIQTDAPGLLIVGSAAGHYFSKMMGALQGMRVLLTCSAALMPKAILAVEDLGGVPIARPMIRLMPKGAAREAIVRQGDKEWVVLTSPSAVKIWRQLMEETSFDLRRVPRIMTCGPGTAAAVREAGMTPDLTPPAEYSAKGLAEALKGIDLTGARVLRFRSEKAGMLLADVMREKGAEVEDVVLYENQEIVYESLPAFDAVFFASASAAESYLRQFSDQSLAGKKVVVMGKPTASVLDTYQPIMPPQSTVEQAIRALISE